MPGSYHYLHSSWHAMIAGVLSFMLGAVLIFVAKTLESRGVLPIAVLYSLEPNAAPLGSSASTLSM